MTGSPTHDVLWKPPLDGTTNVERFMADHAIRSFDELVTRSIAEPEWFWSAVVDFLGLPFASPWDHVLDVSDVQLAATAAASGSAMSAGIERSPSMASATSTTRAVAPGQIKARA